MSSQKNKLVLGYWKMRGRAQCIRFALEYFKDSYEDKYYDSREEWYNNDMKDLGLDFPNLPYLIDGEFNVTETMAILYYVCIRNKKPEMLGKDQDDKLLLKMLEEYINDFYKDIVSLAFNDKYEMEKEKFFTFKATQRLVLLSTYISTNDYLLPYLTYLDFFLFEMLNTLDAMKEDFIKDFSAIKSYWNRLQNLPNIKAYMESDRFMKKPFYPPGLAKFYEGK